MCLYTPLEQDFITITVIMLEMNFSIMCLWFCVTRNARNIRNTRCEGCPGTEQKKIPKKPTFSHTVLSWLRQPGQAAVPTCLSEPWSRCGHEGVCVTEAHGLRDVASCSPAEAVGQLRPPSRLGRNSVASEARRVANLQQARAHNPQPCGAVPASECLP